jgi:uncharacterized protein (TIGR02246 family)
MSQPADEPSAALVRFSEAMLAEDSEDMAEAYTADAQLLLQHHEPIIGRDAIRGFWAGVFAVNRTAAFEADYPLLEVQGDRAYALGRYRETAVERGSGKTWLISGRAVFFIRRDTDGVWRVALALNSHDRPPEELE